MSIFAAPNPRDAEPEARPPDDAVFAALPALAALESAASVAVAVSGGPDSMALAALAARWAAARNIRLYALTVDHGLRPAAAAEAAQVGPWLSTLPVPPAAHVVLTRDKAGAGRVMERARDDRYALMACWCAERDVRHLMTAHHRDDQAETFLFRLAKGSGLDGLAGIRPVSDYNAALTLVRPLLDMGKDQLVAYCEQAAIPFVRDPTNADLSYARNRLGAAMAVLGLEGLSAKRLAVTARRMMQARQALDHYAQCADKAARIATYADEIIYDYEKLSGEPEETRRRVLMMAMAEMQAGRAYAPRMEKLEALAAALFSDPAFTRATLGGFVIGRDVGARRVTVAREAVKKA